MFDFLFEYTPRGGENLIDRPLSGKFLIPIAQLRNRSFIIPDDPEISILEFLTVRPRAYYRTHARRIGRALCLAGVPVFDERGRIRVYCPRFGARVVLEAFDFSSGGLTPPAEKLRNHAETRNLAALTEFCGAVEYKLLDGAIVVEGERRYRLPPGATLL
jgi:hypothetical protein